MVKTALALDWLTFADTFMGAELHGQVGRQAGGTLPLPLLPSHFHKSVSLTVARVDRCGPVWDELSDECVSCVCVVCR
jgi:hypothetical protein